VCVVKQIQEYVEAATVVEYAKSGTLATLHELNQSFANVKDADNMPFTISIPDYILGVCDSVPCAFS
jgi:predicted translin family RNA/ssDNA-binding protein